MSDDVVVARAVELRRAASRGSVLRGRHVALTQPDRDPLAEQRFAAAALGLGARLSRIDPEGVVRAAAGATDAIQMLDRLYDVLDCGTLSWKVATAVQRRLSIPVFDGLARFDHPIARLCPRIGADPGDEPGHVLLIQAVLACALGR